MISNDLEKCPKSTKRLEKLEIKVDQGHISIEVLFEDQSGEFVGHIRVYHGVLAVH